MIATTGETVVNMFTQRYGKREPDTTNTHKKKKFLSQRHHAAKKGHPNNRAITQNPRGKILLVMSLWKETVPLFEREEPQYVQYRTCTSQQDLTRSTCVLELVSATKTKILILPSWACGLKAHIQHFSPHTRKLTYCYAYTYMLLRQSLSETLAKISCHGAPNFFVVSNTKNETEISKKSCLWWYCGTIP